MTDRTVAALTVKALKTAGWEYSAHAAIPNGLKGVAVFSRSPLQWRLSSLRVGDRVAST
jgi:hypothetical protein